MAKTCMSQSAQSINMSTRCKHKVQQQGCDCCSLYYTRITVHFLSECILIFHLILIHQIILNKCLVNDSSAQVATDLAAVTKKSPSCLIWHILLYTLESTSTCFLFQCSNTYHMTYSEEKKTTLHYIIQVILFIKLCKLTLKNVSAKRWRVDQTATIM